MNDDSLLGYFEIHSRTERALFHRDQVLRLFKLADEEPPTGLPEWFSARSGEIDPLVKKARVRMKNTQLQEEIDDARYELIAGFMTEGGRESGRKMTLGWLVRQAYDHHEDHHAEAGAPRARLHQLEKENARLRTDLVEAINALRWCSGANEFLDEGPERDAFKKVVEPVFQRTAWVTQ